METGNLPFEAQTRLDGLVEAIVQTLSVKSAHLAARSNSAMESGTGPRDILSGGQLEAPEKPPFNYDQSSLSALHRAVYEASEGLLRNIFVRCRRPDQRSPWTCTTKLLSNEEYAEVAAARKPIVAAIEAALKAREPAADWERMSFGRDLPGKDPVVVCKSSAGLEKSAPGEPLAGLLQRAEELYRIAGLDLQVAYWSLRPAGLDFREYFE